MAIRPKTKDKKQEAKDCCLPQRAPRTRRKTSKRYLSADYADCRRLQGPETRNQKPKTKEIKQRHRGYGEKRSKTKPLNRKGIADPRRKGRKEKNLGTADARRFTQHSIAASKHRLWVQSLFYESNNWDSVNRYSPRRRIICNRWTYIR